MYSKIIPKLLMKILIAVILGLAVISNAVTGIYLFLEYLNMKEYVEPKNPEDDTDL
jgi:capsular polysaccharide biosynthesis protein